MSSLKKGSTSHLLHKVAARMNKVIFLYENFGKLLYTMQVIGGITGQHIFINRTPHT